MELVHFPLHHDGDVDGTTSTCILRAEHMYCFYLLSPVPSEGRIHNIPIGFEEISRIEKLDQLDRYLLCIDHKSHLELCNVTDGHLQCWIHGFLDGGRNSR